MLERLRRFFLLLLLWPTLLLAAEIEILDPQMLAYEEGYALSANFQFELNPRLEEAVNKGVTLHFVVDFELNRPRWYWLDEKLLTKTQTYSLAYHALTRKYRLSTGGLHQSFVSMAEAVQVLSRLRYWSVIEKTDKAFRPGDAVQAALRIRLDVTQLPRPFQISALGNKDWSLASDWKTWSAVLPLESK